MDLTSYCGADQSEGVAFHDNQVMGHPGHPGDVLLHSILRHHQLFGELHTTRTERRTCTARHPQLSVISG